MTARLSNMDRLEGASQADLAEAPERNASGRGMPEARSGHWFWSTVWQYRRDYYETAIASCLINVLTLAGTFFTMTVYDRVVPHETYATLWVLAIGTFIASLFEFVLRGVRNHFIESAGKKADLRLGSMLFAQAMAIRSEYRPGSAGTFAHHLKEFETVRDFATSATLATLTDLPFALLFLAVIASIAGPLVWWPLAAIPVVVVAGLLIQFPLSRLVKGALHDSAKRHGLLMESLEGVETLRATGALGTVRTKFDEASAGISRQALQSRYLSSLLGNGVTLLQQWMNVAIVISGVYLIHEGKLSMGALIACVILSGRAVAPLGQVAALLVRFQSARSALKTLDSIMSLPSEHESGRQYLRMTHAAGALRLEEGVFAFRENAQRLILDRVNIDIRAGERVAILGKIGSGKSTMLRMLGGFLRPVTGAAYLDGVDLSQLDPDDVHRLIGLLPQEAMLFRGTLRENLLLGCANVPDERLIEATQATGVDRIASRHPKGFDMPVGEKGAGLSVGQRQLVCLTRLLLKDSPVWLLDEPTASLDTASEKALMPVLKKLMEGRTVVLVTHQMRMLELVERIVVVDQGKVVVDGPKAQVLKALGAPGGAA